MDTYAFVDVDADTDVLRYADAITIAFAHVAITDPIAYAAPARRHLARRGWRARIGLS